MLAMAAWWAAQVTWRILTPTEPVTVSVGPMSGGSAATRTVQLDRVQRLFLFGEEGRQPEARRVTEAPETTLNIRLVGVTASNNPNLSAAIIQQGASQAVYIAGDTIASSRAVVDEILSDRVLLNNNNRLETLWLEGRDGSESGLNVQTEAARPATPARQQSAAPATARQQELLQHISITPEQGDNGITGFRLSPRGDGQLFREAGLQDGDVAVAINGFDLTNPADAMVVMEEIQTMTDAQIRVRRGDEYVDIEIRMPNE